MVLATITKMDVFNFLLIFFEMSWKVICFKKLMLTVLLKRKKKRKRQRKGLESSLSSKSFCRLNGFHTASL